ncbi:hypothetical protein [Bacillus sp. FJAT-44742]|uniref:hypothetical protein n=1 Tax=Bacillus sp. FJAT-44742 TaxID=2014005 RepID=UPI000C248788|nr:hypothetical protein [Bacillus sp. FJAT-44742]
MTPYSFTSFDHAAENVLKMVSGLMEVNTLFIAKNDKQDVEIVKSFNRDRVIIEAGFETDYEESY